MSTDEPRADSPVTGAAEQDPTVFGEAGETGETWGLDETDAEGLEGEDLDDLEYAEQFDEFGQPIAPVAAAPGIGRRLLGIVLGLVLAVAGAAGWAALTTASGRRFALLAVIVGILIGLVVRRVGKISGLKGGVIAGLLSLLGAAMGQFFEGYALQANAIADSPIVDLAHQDWTLMKQWEEWGFSKGWDVFTNNLDPLSWLTLALAAAAAFIYASDSGKRKPVVAEEDETMDETGEYMADDELATVEGDLGEGASAEAGLDEEETEPRRATE